MTSPLNDVSGWTNPRTLQAGKFHASDATCLGQGKKKSDNEMGKDAKKDSEEVEYEERIKSLNEISKPLAPKKLTKKIYKLGKNANHKETKLWNQTKFHLKMFSESVWSDLKCFDEWFHAKLSSVSEANFMAK